MNYLDFFNTTLSVIILIFLSTFNIIYLYFRFFFSKEQKKTELSQSNFGCSNEVMDRMDKMEKAMDRYNEAFAYINQSNVFLSKEYKDIIDNDKDVKRFINQSRDNIQFDTRL